MSGGERQRLVIARALAQEAPILLLDEPTSALDIGHQQQALELVDRLRHEHGLTVVSAMHDLTLAGLYSDRLALLHQGPVVTTGDAAHVLRAETLSEFYGVSVAVHHEPDGTVVVIPKRTTSALTTQLGTNQASPPRQATDSLGPHVPRKYGLTGPGSSSAGWTMRHVCSTMSSRAKRRGEPADRVVEQPLVGVAPLAERGGEVDRRGRRLAVEVRRRASWPAA